MSESVGVTAGELALVATLTFSKQRDTTVPHTSELLLQQEGQGQLSRHVLPLGGLGLVVGATVGQLRQGGAQANQGGGSLGTEGRLGK